MLVTNQRLDQLAAARTNLKNRGMLSEAYSLCVYNYFHFLVARPIGAF
jgi:hypothetical protein